MSLFIKKKVHWTFLNLICQKQTSVYNSHRLLSIVSPDRIYIPSHLKGRFASGEQRRIITQFVTSSDLSNLDWNTLKTSVLSINRGFLNERNINGCILDICSQHKRLDLAKSYVKYVKECGETKHSLALELLYMRSCYSSRNQLTDDDRNEIQAKCQFLSKNYSTLLNSVFLEGIIMGLCCTSSWRDSLKYLKTNEKDLTVNSLMCIALKAFEESEVELGWSLTQKLYLLHEVLSTELFDAWFNLCDNNKNYSNLRVLEFLMDNECIVRKDLAEFIRKKFTQLGSKITNTIIHHDSGKCSKCNQVLKPATVTNSEFKKLQDCFMSNVVIGKNIFNNSSPQELNEFKDFIESTMPYDVVVDGLNLAYAYRGKVAENSLTKTVMNIFIKQKLKVLLIGRKHLIRMLGKEFDFIKRNVHIFFTNDLSKDDPFVLYAAMCSGLGTKILTRDLMRSHKFILKDKEIKSVFQKWLQKHRLSIRIRPGNQVSIINPIIHLQSTQESEHGIWHLPYQEIKKPGFWSKPDSSPDNWMCIKLN